MTDRSIAGVGAYAPADRISAEEFTEALGTFGGTGIRQKAVPGVDEDSLTMAAEAATIALETTAVDAGDVDGLLLATTTPPMDEEDPTPRLASMLGLDRSVETELQTGSTLAGVDALTSALERTDDTATLVVASDAPRGAPDSAIEHAAGAGAVALVLAADGSAPVVDRATASEPYPGTRFRPHGSGETTSLDATAYERSSFSETLGDAADGVDVDGIDAAAVQAPNGKLPYRAAGALGVETDDIQRCATVHDLGDVGAASALLSFAAAVDDGAERVLIAGYGSGASATALVVENDGVETTLETDADGDDLSYARYLRRRGELTSGEPDGGGAYVSVPTWKRSIPQRHRLEAGVCPDCGVLSFPPDGACDGCGGLVEYEPIRLPGTGTVEAVTTIQQGGAPPEFVEQQARDGAFQSAVVAFDGPGGETVSVPAQVIGSVEVGDHVEATIRRIYEQEDVIRYGFKVRPR
ncbi:zinc ribbon domain-containing protein [Natrarchaeobius oligotrophus]|uniref:ACP synthase n=1 Tax=Natrarchaeobius chitinivorans TaxID=1679083 RepID=A0A3N6PS87_NATCH|nr:zinc ribbon domain-containing protein [Natrarchaeobius chitinivorans]RQH02356.1 ACP synthase [Natrarchaeobius chitinivorans]